MPLDVLQPFSPSPAAKSLVLNEILMAHFIQAAISDILTLENLDDIARVIITFYSNKNNSAEEFLIFFRGLCAAKCEGVEKQRKLDCYRDCLITKYPSIIKVEITIADSILILKNNI